MRPFSRTWWTELPTANASHEYRKQRSAEGGSAIDARSSEVSWEIAIFRRLQAIDSWNVWDSTAVASREKSKRQMETTISIKWYGSQKLNLFASAADKCGPSSSAFERHTEGSIQPISTYKFNFRSNIVHTYYHLCKGRFNMSATQIRMTSYKLWLLWRKGKTSKSV